MSTVEVTILGNYRYDFLLEILFECITLVAQESLKKESLRTLHQIPDRPKFPKSFLKIDVTLYSNSKYYVTTSLFFLLSSQSIT